MSPVSNTSELASVAVSLIVILALVFTVAQMVRRWQAGGRIRRENSPSAIRVVAVRAAGWQSSLQIVEADGQRFLIAAGRNGVTTIGRLSAADAGRSSRPES